MSQAKRVIGFTLMIVALDRELLQPINIKKVYQARNKMQRKYFSPDRGRTLILQSGYIGLFNCNSYFDIIDLTIPVMEFCVYGH